MRKVHIFLILLALLLTWLQWPVIMSPRPRDLGGRLMPPLIPSQHLSSAARWKSQGGELLTCDIYCKHYISSLGESLCLNIFCYEDLCYREPCYPTSLFTDPSCVMSCLLLVWSPDHNVMTVSQAGHMVPPTSDDKFIHIRAVKWSNAKMMFLEMEVLI